MAMIEVFLRSNWQHTDEFKCEAVKQVGEREILKSRRVLAWG